MEKQTSFTHRQVFITNEKWLSYPKEIRDELNDNIFTVIDRMDNHGENQDGVYDHLHQLVRNGYLNFDEYALMPKHSRSALLNLLWRSSVSYEESTWAFKHKLFTFKEFLSFPEDFQDELISILNKPIKEWYRYVDLTEEQKVEILRSKLREFKENMHLRKKWNQGYVPDIQEGRTISQEELDKINKQSGDASSDNIKWEFDPYRSLYFYRVAKENVDIKTNQQPIKRTDDMVVFSLNNNKGK